MKPEKVKKHAINYLVAKAQAEKQQSLASLTLLLDCPAGIGDHSTADYHKNLDEALDQLAHAEDKLSILKSQFSEHFPVE